MSADIDQRGREAGARMRALVEDATLHPSVPGLGIAALVPAPRPLLKALTAGGTVLAIVVVLMWLVVPDSTTDEPVATTTTSIVTTTSAGTEPSDVVPVPPDQGPNRAPEPIVIPVTPLSLSIATPVDGSVFLEKTIEFAGSTNPGARVFAGVYEAAVDDGGNWSILLVLAEGTNTATFRAVDGAGNEALASVTVTYAPPTTTTAKAPEETTTTKPELAEFDANFTWGVCNVQPPFDEYYGVGQPGSEVKVVSEYGSGVTVVNGEGHWYLKVEFPEAPPGVAFLVRVKDQYGREELFEFKFEA